jgi:PAS domain S-box-containing protein
MDKKMEKTRILVVDDDESVLEYLQTSLDILGYEVTAAGTATEAIGKLREAPEGFPLAITDIMMPGIGGMELLRIIKKNFPATIVIMLTAYVSTDSAIQSLNEGAFAYLTKPINVDELKVTLSNAHRSYTLERENKKLMEELRQAKDYDDAIINNLIYLVVGTDSSGNIKKINKAMENLLGYKEKELIGAPLQMLFTQDFNIYWQEMMKENRVIDLPVSFHTKDGQEMVLHFTGTIMKDADGRVIGFLGTARQANS